MLPLNVLMVREGPLYAIVWNLHEINSMLTATFEDIHIDLNVYYKTSNIY